MPLSAGTHVGSYEILSALGAGGMGEVYRARDTRLDRDVAVKIVPELFAADPDRLMRFEREAKTLAALNHPGIAHVYGVEQSGPLRALVMELVDGEDLAQLVARGPLPLDQAVALARQIAAALEAAHEAGIIHRDLKPANVKVREDGAVKVLDFGLAKALDPAPADALSAAHSPTFTSPDLTQMGVLLGTAAYMAPEQARGKAVDKRADIWAFGCVLYEMLTGRTAFAGETLPDTLAAIMTRTPDLAALPAGTPPAVRRLLARCLERDPTRRLRDIGEARLALEDGALGAEPEAATAVAARPSRARTLAWVAATLAAAAITGALVWHLRAPADSPVRRFLIPTSGDATPLRAAIAPGGEVIAYIADERIWLQRLDEFTATEVPSTSGAHALFWSPDGAFLAFQARSQLWKVPPTGGAPVAIGAVPQDFTRAGGAAWLDDGRIVFTTGGTGLLEIRADGGRARPLLEIDPASEADFHNVSALPGGRGVLFVNHRTGERWRIELYVPAERRREVVHTPEWNPSRPVYAPSGHLLYEAAGSIWMLPFSLDRLAVQGEPARVAADAREPSVSRDGTLVMLPGRSAGSDAQLVWLDRSASVVSTVGQTGQRVAHARASPDGRLVAATVGGPPESDIWIFDAARGTERRLTFDAGRNEMPIWSPDGRHVIYNCGRAICARHADGSGARVELIDGIEPMSPPAVTPDGRQIVFVRETQPGVADLWIAELGPDGAASPVTAAPRPLFSGDRTQHRPEISPDGRYIAYVSNETGINAVYVTRFPSGEGKWPISTGYALWPRWGAAGDRLYFLDELGRIAEREVSIGASFEPGRLIGRTVAMALTAPGFDVSRDGSQFLLPRAVAAESRAASLMIVQHWSRMAGGL
jgi:eukaryotic-like serine/threonine-protein kinase